MDKKVAVIGSNSFSGATFVKFLINKGHNVLGFSRSPEPEQIFLPYKYSNRYKKQFFFKQVDLNKNLTDLVKIFEKEKPEYIINFSALGMVAQSWKSPCDWYQTNVVAQVKLHDELRKFDFIKKYVHVTTPEVYGSTDGWIKENFIFNPSTPYAVSRASCDMHLNSFISAYNFPAVFTRAANVYGPGQQLYRIIPRAVLYAKLGKKLSLHGGGNSDRSFIHMEDVSNATYKIALNGNIGNSYHISTKKTISIKGLVDKLCDMLNINFFDLVEISDDRLGKDQSYKLDSNKIRDELNWVDLIKLEEGLDQTIKWVEDNIEIMKILPHNYVHKS